MEPLEGKTLVYRKDPVFNRAGWCIMGSLVAEMQTMEWVDALVEKHGAAIWKAVPGDVAKVIGGELVQQN